MISPLKNVNFNQKDSTIKSVGFDGSNLTIQINIDLFSLKIFALLMCKGGVKEKAECLFDLILGPEEKK